MDTKRRSRRSSVGGYVVLIVVLILTAFGYIHRQVIIDIVRAYQYRPQAEISAIKYKLDLTASGQHLFKASVPELESAADFNQSCNQSEETNNPILGCYRAQRIYVYNVTNQQLNGIEETTAAHELLHAVYERMSADEKNSVNQALETAYVRVKTPELEKRMQYYEQSEPGEKLNELHSILGTEFPSLGSTLEAHYKKYFNDRAKIVAYHNQYSAVFSSAQAKLTNLESEINQKIVSINQQIKDYESVKDAYESARLSYNNSETRSAEKRASLLSQQTSLNATRDTINAAVDQVNQLKMQYNTLAKQYNELNTSINSSLMSTPSMQEMN